MQATPTPPQIPPPVRRRSLLVTVTGWLVIGLSALGLPISVITVLMIMAKSYGTENIEVLGFLTVVCGPPAGIVTGIGLLLRHRWARWFLIVALLAIIGTNLRQTFWPKPTIITRTTATGVTTTLLPGTPSGSWPVIALCAGLMVILSLPSVRAEFRRRSRIDRSPTPPVLPLSPSAPARRDDRADRARGWRVGHRGRDMMYYEEWRDGEWQRLDIDGEMLCGRAHHVIYFPSHEKWAQFPEWAQARRDEIIARIKSEFRPPDYEYWGEETQAATPSAPGPAPVGSSAAPVHRAPTAPYQPSSALPAPPRESRTGLVFAIVVLLAIAGGTAWLIQQGIDSGETRLPVKRGTPRRTIHRAEEPALFWTSIGVFSTLSIGCFGLAVWLTKEGFMSGKRQSGSSRQDR